MNNRLKALIKTLEQSNVSYTDFIKGLVLRLDEMEKNGFFADDKWTTEIVFKIMGHEPAILDDKKFVQFCDTLPLTNAELDDKEYKLFFGEDRPKAQFKHK